MKTIPFTQYLRPNGRKVTITIDVEDELGAKAEELMKDGARFEIEELMTMQIHMDCMHEDEPLSSQICENGQEVVENVKKLIIESHEEWLKKK